MESKKLSLPRHENTGPANSLPYRLARQQLAGIPDMEELCRRGGAQYSEKSVTLQYLNRSYLITLPDAEISLIDSHEAVPIRDKILILHYLLTARGTASANKSIAFHELPEGSVYYPTFAKRTIQPLVDNFGSDSQFLLPISRKLGGQKADYGDAAVAINAFPHVPITIVLWRGDSEFPARGNVLFDATISHYLPTEDVTVLCETIVWRLVGLKRSV
ncbi:MAG: DUF3786 domain-containing protein [Dehalococcoidales bacterium]|nr:DUF3786 domain-containing protein [Dehalococcoidales bacterium]